MRKMRNVLLSMAFASWCDAVVLFSSLRGTALRALRSFQKALLRSAWNRWSWLITKLHRDSILLRKVMGRMRHRRSSLAFARWRESVIALKHMRNVANIVIARITRRELATSFDTWVYTIAAEKARQAAHADRRRKMLASLRHMQNSNLFAAFHGWNENIKTLRKRRRKG